MLTVGSLFAGIGGFDLGFERAGMRTVWFCEQDEFCRRVLAKRWPGVPCYPDVRALVAHTDSAAHTAEGERGEAVRTVAAGSAGGPSRSGDGGGGGGLVPVQVPPVDVLCGGFPCQDLSIAGKAAGLGGTRSGLWSEFARLIGELRPRYVVVENVSALLARGLGTVLGDLATLGYDAEWDCIPASAVGAPHQRDRIWIVAYPSRDAETGVCAPAGSERERAGQGGESGGTREDVADADLSVVRAGLRSSRAAGQRRRQPGDGGGPRGAGDVADAGRERVERGGDPGDVLRSPGAAEGEGDQRKRRWRSAWDCRPGGSGMARRSGADPDADRGGREVERLEEPAGLERAPGGVADGSRPDVAHTPVEGLEGLGAESGQPALAEPRHRRALAYADSEGPLHVGEGEAGCAVGGRYWGWHTAGRGGPAGWSPTEWWATEPDVGRVAHGVPMRVDRLRSLGNALVPQIAEWIGRRIIDYEARA